MSVGVIDVLRDVGLLILSVGPRPRQRKEQELLPA